MTNDATRATAEAMPETSRRRPCTAEEAAVLTFEPWADKEPLPHAAYRQDMQILGMLFPYCYDLMFKTKEELTTEIGEWSDEKGDLMMRAFIDCRAFLKTASQLVTAAEARILIAGSTVAVTRDAA